MVLPVARRLPAVVLHRGPAVGEPQRRVGVAAVLDEGEPFAVGHQRARDAHRPDQHAVRRPFIVEAIAVGLVADGVDAFGQFDEAVFRARLVARLGRRPVRVIGRRGRVLREGMQDVGEEQLLMLLLVIEPDFEDAQDFRQRGGARLGDQRLHRGIDMRAIGRDLGRHPAA